MTPEQIKALVERSSVKLPEPTEYKWESDGTFDIGQVKQLSPNNGPCSGWKVSPTYTADQLHAVIAEMQEALEVVLQDNTCIEDMQNEIVWLKGKLEAAKSVPMRYKRMAFNAELQEEVQKLKAERDRNLDSISVGNNIINRLTGELEAAEKDAALGRAMRPNYEAAKKYGTRHIHWNVEDIYAAMKEPK